MSGPDQRPAFQTRSADGVFWVTLAKPEKLNALTEADAGELTALLEHVSSDETVRCLVLTGAGRGFCAGRDISGAREGEDAGEILTGAVNPLIQRLYELPQPTIAAVNGAAMGVGLGLALACDIVLAGESARFSSPFARLGAALDSGGHFFLPRRLPRGRVHEMVYTGEAIDGAEAVRLGLADRLAPDSVLLSTAEDLARRIADGPQDSLRSQKALLRASERYDLSEVLRQEAALQGRLAKTADYAEGVAAFQARRPPVFRRTA